MVLLNLPRFCMDISNQRKELIDISANNQNFSRSHFLSIMAERAFVLLTTWEKSTDETERKFLENLITTYIDFKLTNDAIPIEKIPIGTIDGIISKCRRETRTESVPVNPIMAEEFYQKIKKINKTHLCSIGTTITFLMNICFNIDVVLADCTDKEKEILQKIKNSTVTPDGQIVPKRGLIV